MKTKIPNLASARRMNNLKQKELADMINVTRQTITSYEAGTRAPDINTLIKLSKILNVSVDYLIGLNDNMIDNSQNQILIKLSKLSSKDYNIIMELINRLSAKN